MNANLYRADLSGYGNGFHAFSFPVPPYLKDGTTHTITGDYGGTQVQINSQSLNCPAGATGYVYYYNDALTSINPGNWTQNGSVSATSSGLTATSANGGSLISVPDRTNDYEVKTTLNVTTSGGTYVSYLRATSDAKSGPAATGSFYSLELTPAYSGQTCSLTMALNKTISGQVTQLMSGGVYCHIGTTVRFSIAGSLIVVTTDNHLWWEYGDSSIPTGKPGVGAFLTPAGNSISAVSFGPIDRIAPQAPNPATFAVSVLPNRLDLAFSGVPDDPNGTGVAFYGFYRDAIWFSSSTGPEFTDETLTPSSTHTYTVYALDYHFNFSPPSSFTITAPPAGAVDPRRIGIRPTGTYWGGSGEQLDMRSGNLNFTLPLLRAQARGGWSVPFALSYNSQNWRQDSGGAWNLGADVGYGYGWKLLAGSLTPYSNGLWGIDHYIFTDSTGAEYRLDQNSGGVVTSRESLYVWFNSNNNTLYFRDGSYWIMGCTSGGSEPDAGTMYPTVMENTNGNQILVYYFPGNNLTWTNSSARIQYIQDVRAVNHGTVRETYTFLYTADVIPHLTSIQNAIGTSEGYLFAYWPTRVLTVPFSNASYPGGFTGLQSVAVLGIAAQHSFYYDGSGEMTQAVFPYNGYFKWNYGSVTYSSGFTQREVQSRILSKDGTAGTEVTYPFAHESSPNFVHQFTSLNDPGGVGQKYWTFSGSGANLGLLTQYKGIQLPSTILAQNDFTWTQDASGNFYIGSTLSTSDPAPPGPAQSKTEQTVDIYGNVTQVKKYNFGSLTTPARTYNYSYLNSPAYASYAIYNRLTLATVTDGTTNVTLASNTYDGGTGTAVSPTPQEWDTSYASQAYRGNVYTAYTPSGVSSFSYNQAGNVTSANVNGLTTTVTNDSTNNFAAPVQLTTGSLIDSLSWSSFLGLTNDTGPNGASTSTFYDSYARPTGTISPFGAVTSYSYTLNPAMVTVTTNDRWTRQTLDGFGRTVKTETGDRSGTRSVSESVYGPCACSPIGKLMQQSMAHAPGASSVTWTTYTYDGIGRTLTAATVGSDTQGTTTYAYAGWSDAQLSSVTDAAGKVKQFATDAFGHLFRVADADGTTYYSYDLLDHLTSVYMPRSNGTQTRTFVYSGNFLIRATNPENGTVNYTYNGYNKVATKTDAKGQKIVYSYDTYARLTKVQRYPTATEDTCQQENYYYDTNPFDATYSQPYSSGRLTAVQYYGGSTTYAYGGTNCDTTFTEMYTYNQAGAKLGKRLRVTRTLAQGIPNVPSTWVYSPYSADLDSTYTYDYEGRMTSVRYPSYSQFGATQPGPNLGFAYDTMGRLNTMTDLTAQSSIISGATYGAAGELLTMAGGVSESRTYNSMRQLTGLASTGYLTQVYVSYNYPATGNNGKIASQTDNLSGEQVVYTYDALNRLASAAATDNSWGQRYTYDGFGNLTDQTVTAGTAPEYHTSFDPATNHSSCTDANGNSYSAAVCFNEYSYDVENRFVAQGYHNFQYSYAPGNKRVWRGVWASDGTLTTDEVAFWGVTGQKLATYQLAIVGGVINQSSSPPQIIATQPATNYYFGAKLIYKNVYVAADRLGSMGKFYPWGQEKPSATTNGTEKFTGYFRDAETGLDYADQRYHSPGTGRFMSPDRYVSSTGPTDPGSWNRYAYVQGDPVNFNDPSGNALCDPMWSSCGGAGGAPGGVGGVGAGGCFADSLLSPEPLPPTCFTYGPIGSDPSEDDNDETKCPDHIQNWINAHGADAATVATELGLQGNVGEADILGLSAIESGWGHPAFTNAFFGMHGPLPGQTGCRKATGNPNVCVSTFSSYLASAQAFAQVEKALIQGVTDPTQFATILNGTKAKFGWIQLANGKYGPNPKYIPGLVNTINAIAACLNM